MLGYACLTGYYDVFAYGYASAYAHPGNKQAVFTYGYIMPYMNLIICFDMATYSCLTKNRSIYCIACTDLYIIIYPNRSNMRNFYVLSRVQCEPKPIATYNRARIYDNTIADLASA